MDKVPKVIVLDDEMMLVNGHFVPRRRQPFPVVRNQRALTEVDNTEKESGEEEEEDKQESRPDFVGSIMELVAINSNSHPHSSGTSSVPLSENSQEIGHVQDIYNMKSNFSLNYVFSDMVLIVQNERFAVHKVVLAHHSEYFRALFYGGLSESNQYEVELHDDNVVAFKCLLKYIYCGKIWTRKLKEDLFLNILVLSQKYRFEDLENNISNRVRDVLTLHNACSILDFSLFYNFIRLKRKVLSFICHKAKSIIAQKSFYNLSQNGLIQIIQRNSFNVPEIEIFKVVQNWVRNFNFNFRLTNLHLRDLMQSIFKSLKLKSHVTKINIENSEIIVKKNSMDTKDEGGIVDGILPYVRLSLISLSELLTTVRSSGIISADKILDAIELQSNDKVKLRGYFEPEKNVATTIMGALLLKGEIKNSLPNCDYDPCYENDTCHEYIINDTSFNDHEIILIKLGTETIVNHIKLLLLDKEFYYYSYYIQVSIDKKNWTTIIDYSRYECRSWQYLYFKTQVVQYIRIVGVNIITDEPIHVVRFEIMYTNEKKEINKDGIIIPHYNVATKELNAIVQAGTNSESLLDGNLKRYNLDTNYTHHKLIGFCNIEVKLGQPYMLESICFILFDFDDRTYSYLIEVSTNGFNYVTVADHTNDSCKGYQLITFPRQPVLSIRIKGTHNTANDFFHCVHFECPAQIKTKDRWAAIHNGEM